MTSSTSGQRWTPAGARCSLCRTAGFKPRFIAIPDGITHVLSMVASESAVTLLPDYFKATTHPDIAFVPVSDSKARWDFIVLWQRGKTNLSTTALVNALKETALQFSGVETSGA